jgi:GTPase SAR1 family protein
MRFGQVVVGPPGSGKTSYCLAMRQYLNAAGRPTAVINLDPANEQAPGLLSIVLAARGTGHTENGQERSGE